MQPVEDVGQVLRASPAADRQSPSFGLPDVGPCLAREPREDPGRILVERDPVPERAAASCGTRQRRPHVHPTYARGLAFLLQGRTEQRFLLRSREQGRQVIGERKRHPLRLGAEVPDFHHRQAGPDLPGCVAGRYREGAEVVALREQAGPPRVMKRRRPRLPGHEVGPAGIGQLQDGGTAHRGTPHGLTHPDGAARLASGTAIPRRNTQTPGRHAAAPVMECPGMPPNPALQVPCGAALPDVAVPTKVRVVPILALRTS
jgi:hypothetical protein